MKILLTIACAILGGSSLCAQNSFDDQFGTSNYNGERCASLQQTSDGGYILTGGHYYYGEDVLLLKTDASGDTLWTRDFRCANVLNSSCVRQTQDGGYILCGAVNSSTAGKDLLLIKTDANGNLQWEKTYGGNGDEEAMSVRALTSGGYIVTGYTKSFGFGAEDVYLVRTDANGDTLWTRCIGGTADDRAYSVRETADGGFILAGLTKSYGTPAGSPNEYVIKTDAAGMLSWSHVFGTTLNDTAFCAAQTSDGGYIVSGTVSQSASSYSIHLLKLDGTGALQWSKAQSAYAYGAAHAVVQTSDGGYLTGGYWGSGVIFYELMKTDASGNLLWNKLADAELYSARAISDLQQTSDHGYAFAYRTDKLVLLKTDSIPSSTCLRDTLPVLLTPTLAVSYPTSGDKLAGGSANTYSLITSSIPVFTQTSCSTVGIAEDESDEKLSVFPNPANENVQVQWGNTVDKTNVELMNVSGEIVYRKTEENENAVNIPTDQLPDGMYLLRVQSGQKLICRRIVVQH